MGLLRRPLLWIPLLLVLLFGAAIAAGYALLPGVVRSQGQAWVETNLPGKVLTLGDITFDPWNLRLDIADIAIADTKAPGQPLVAIKALAVDASISSLWQRHARLDAVTVDTPVIDAVLRKDGSINLVELVPPDDGTPVPEVWIGDLKVRKGTLFFTDDRRTAPVRKTLTPVTFDLRDFATRATSGGGFKFDAASDDGERFAWAGKLSMAPLASDGSFSISALKLASIGKFAGDLLPVALTAGQVDLGGQYRFAVPPVVKGAAPPALQFDADLTSFTLADAAMTASTGDALAIKRLTVAPTKVSLAGDALAVGDIAITGIDVRRPGGEHATVANLTLAATRYGISSAVADIGAAAVTGISVTGRGKGAETVALAGITVAPSQVAMTPHTAKIGMVTLNGLRLAAHVAADNSVTIPGLWPMALPKSAPAAGPAWTTSLAGFAMTDAAVQVAVARPPPMQGGTFNLAPMTAKLGPVTSALDTPLALDFATGINGKAKFAVSGTASLRNSTADLAVDLAGLPLAEFAAMAPPSPVLVRSGTLSAKGRLLVANSRAGPAPDFKGNVGVANLDLAQRSSGANLLSWKKLDVTGIRYQSAPQKLAIQRMAFDRAISHVIITREAKLNLATVAGVETPSLTSPEPAAVAETPAGVPATAAAVVPVTAAAVAPVTAAAVAESAATGKKSKTVRKIRIAAPVSNTLNAAAKLFPVSIGEIAVRGSTISFEDFSIEPNFAARIEGFSGAVTGLSTAPGSQARFNLKGYVIDRFAPVTITGRANVFNYDANTDLTASFKNIELPVFNPYSGRFAGYAIAKGKLSTTIHYRIVNRGLNAEHNIVLDQLTWGEATDSQQKVSLPIRLATSLLKDKNGVIDLSLPVEGTLDDPKFKIWPLVWKVVGNVLTKLITAPFAMIGSLFGGGDNAQFVGFDAGSAVLPPDADKSLKAIAKGLAEKTEVNLDIPAGAGIREDAEAMTTRAIETAALAGKKGPAAADYASFDVSKKADKLKSLYKAKFGNGPKFPDGVVPKAGMLAGGEAKAAAAAAEVKWLEEALRPKYAPTDAELAALGQARANAVKEVLLADDVIAPTRVFVATDKTVAPKDGKVVMELVVK
ncbi:MAG: DUF748 domain-containing protein [Polymorphobacter sp.]